MSEATDRCSLLARSSSRSQSSCSKRIALAIEAIPDTIGYVSSHVQKANVGRKYRAHLTGGAEQAEAVAQVDGACRVVGRLMIERHQMRHSFPGRFRLAPSAQLTELRNDVPWLKDAPVHALQNELRCVQQAFENWGQHGRGYPTPRKKKDGVRIKFADTKSDWKIRKVAGRVWEVRLPKQLGVIRFVKHRPFGGAVKSVTLSSKAGRWFVSFGIAERKPKPTSKAGIIGVDLGVVETIATSHPIDLGDGRGPQRLHRMPALLSEGEAAHFYRLELRAAEQAEARKRRGGPITRSHRRTYLAIARVHARIARRRLAWLRLVANRLGEYGTVVFENLNVSAMTRSARGTTERPGRNVRAKAGLNRAILRNGWGYLRTFTAEQTAVLQVSARYSSQECRQCGHISPENRTDRDTFQCQRCGHENHADLNASEVIEARGSWVLSGDSQLRAVAAHSRKAGGTKNREAKAA